jgi:adenylate kinase
LAHISTGDLLREAVSVDSELGRKAKSYMDQGALVPDAVVVELIRKKLPKSGGFVLDGFPRTIDQADALDAMLSQEHRSVQAAINITVVDEEVVRRLSGRQQCAKGHVFHVEFNPSKTPSRCDRCSEPLSTRSDDLPATVRKRLEVYRRQTEPLVERYRHQGILKVVDGEGVPEGVGRAIDGALDVKP